MNTQHQLPGTTSYGYDLNGNMTSRTNTAKTQNNLSTTYSVLNLPKSVTLANGTVIQYTYDASGRKLRRLVGTAATEYISGIQYSVLRWISFRLKRAGWYQMEEAISASTI